MITIGIEMVPVSKPYVVDSLSWIFYRNEKFEVLDTETRVTN
jgi:hypothetical protein